VVDDVFSEFLRSIPGNLHLLAQCLRSKLTVLIAASSAADPARLSAPPTRKTKKKRKRTYRQAVHVVRTYAVETLKKANLVSAGRKREYKGNVLNNTRIETKMEFTDTGYRCWLKKVKQLEEAGIETAQDSLLHPDSDSSFTTKFVSGRIARHMA
jgi:hypothetical protein